MTPLDTPPPIPQASFSLLSFHQGRFTRLSYIAWQILLNIAFLVAMFVFIMSAGVVGFSMTNPPEMLEQMFEYLSGWVGWAFILLYSYFAIVIYIRRLHDCSCSGWWVLLQFVPILNILLFFFLLIVPGTKNVNQYGLPRPTPSLEKLVAWLGLIMLLLLLVGLSMFSFFLFQETQMTMPQNIPDVSDYF